jgi:regulatory protein
MTRQPSGRRSRRATPADAVVLPPEGGVISAITALRRGRYRVEVDGQPALVLTAETLAASGLQVGSPASAEQLRRLAADDARRQALDVALRLLGYRPRAEQELRERLTRRGFPAEAIEATLARLRDYGYVDDAAFARAWVERRTGAAARGRRLLLYELRGKGVDPEVAARSLQKAPDDLETARGLAERKVRSLRGLDARTFRQRLGAYLQRRGFAGEVIASVVRELWRREQAAADGDRPAADADDPH